MEFVQNWSPAQDLILVPDIQDTSPRGSGSSDEKRPDRLFLCMGKGTQSAITELRFGLEAKVDLECVYDLPIMHAWVLRPSVTDAREDTILLLSLPNRSALLGLVASSTKQGELDLEEIDEDDSAFDLSSRTISASNFGSLTIQITERGIRYIEHNKMWAILSYVTFHRSTANSPSLVQLRETDLLSAGHFISHAVIHQNMVIFTTFLGPSSYSLRLLMIFNSGVGDTGDTSTLSHRLITLSTFDSPISAIACGLQDSKLTLIAAGNSTLRVFSLENSNGGENMTSEHESLELIELPISSFNMTDSESIVSAVMVDSPSTGTGIICGTDRGSVMTFAWQQSVDARALDLVNVTSFGTSPAILTTFPVNDQRIFVTCGFDLYALVLYKGSHSSAPALRPAHVWLTEAHTPALPQHDVNAVACLDASIATGASGGLLIISGSHILLTTLTNDPGPVPRHLAIGGTPSRMIYSSRLNAFIVSVTVDGLSALIFVDPKSGANLSLPVDHNGAEVDHISGLGNHDDYIYDLCEWSYNKDGRPWHFVIMCTKRGRLLIVSTEKTNEPAQLPHNIFAINEDTRQPPMKIRFWTRHKIKCSDSVYSVVGMDEGIVYATGKNIYYDRLVEKKFRTVAQCQLLSPAISMSLNGGGIHAITQSHSLQILQMQTDEDDKVHFNLTHTDQLTRCGSHHLTVNWKPERTIHLVATRKKCVVGLWPSQSTQADTLDTLFEAHLDFSLQRLRLGSPRPIWDDTRHRLGLKTSRADQSRAQATDIVGMGINGSVCHLTLLTIKEWRWLKFLDNLAHQSPAVCPFTFDTEILQLEPKLDSKSSMHINGDVLRHCIERSSLANLLGIGDDSEQAKARHRLFIELVSNASSDAPKGSASRGNHRSLSACIDFASDMLAHYLRSVL